MRSGLASCLAAMHVACLALQPLNAAEAGTAPAPADTPYTLQSSIEYGVTAQG